jgi:hypothetical protein
MRKFVIISPYGAPGTNGLGDHVDQIIAALAERGLPAIKKIGVTTSAHEADISRGIVMIGDSPGLDHLLDRFVSSDCTLVVHYVGHGYQRHGCPFWLIRSLRRLRSLRNVRMISVFHELYASGPPWTSTFYVAPFQRFLFRALVSLSDEVVTSTPAYRRIVEQQGKNAGTHPVISNIGEPLDPCELKERANRAVVFGLPHSRRPLFESNMLEPALQRLSIDEVLEIGKPCSQRTPNVSGLRWHQCGELSGKEVSELFLQSRFGLLLYPRNLLSKSGVFAAYSSHRMVPVLLAKPGSPVEELKPHLHYLDSSDMGSIDTTTLQGIADQSWRWYVNARSLAVCRELYIGWCRD